LPDEFDCRKAPGHRTPYADFSIRQLSWQFDLLDVSRGEVHLKVFGGTEVVGNGVAAKPAIGKLNSEAAIQVLRLNSRRQSRPATPIPYRDRRGGAAVAWENQSRGRYQQVSRTCQVFPD